MSLVRMLAALAVAIPLAMPAQEPTPAAQSPKALLEAMQNNVGRISPSLEYDRWGANIALWEVRLEHPGKGTSAVLAQMRKSLGVMTGIVSQIRGPEEKERWELNRDMWTTLVDEGGAPPAASRQSLRNMLKRLRANVEKIAAPGERERWTVNCDLWQAELGTK